MFAAQPVVSGFCPDNSPSSRCLQTSANSPGLKGCRGRAQLNALPTLHFLAKPVQWDFGVKCRFLFSLSASVASFFSTQVRSVIHYQVFCPRSLCHHAFPSQFFPGNRLGPQTCQQDCDVWLLPAAGNGTVLARDYRPSYHHGLLPLNTEGDGFQIHCLPVASWD